MAIQNTTFLDLTGLTSYDTKIKQWANSVNQLAFKTAHTDTDGNYLYLYKKANAVLGTDTPDTTIALGGGDLAAKLDALAAICGATWDSVAEEFTITLDSTFDENTDTIVDALNELKGQINILNGDNTTTGSVAKSIKDAVEALDVTEFPIAEVSSNVVTIHGIKEQDGEIAVGNTAANDIVLEEVAYTGAAADVSVADTAGKITATTVEDALAEIVDNDAAKAVYFTDNTSTTGTDYATIYKIYQGTGSAASPVAGELVGTINIPKDQFVDEASLVDVYFDDSDDTLHEGSISGPDVTEAIMGSGVTPTAADAGKYMKIVFAITTGTAAKSTIYISVKTLSHVYTGGSTSEITIAVNASTDVITGTIVDIDGTKITYIAADAGTSTPRESVSAALARLDGSDSTTGSVAKKIKDAIDGLDTSSDISVASYAAGSTPGTDADVITFQGSIKEENGVIATGTADTVTLSSITTSQINGLFS